LHNVARDEHNGSGTGRRRLAIDGQLIGSFDDEEHFFLTQMDVVGRALAGLVPSHDNRDGPARGLSSEEYFHFEAERLDPQRLFGPDDGGLQW
jgi:hypothetical protein